MGHALTAWQSKVSALIRDEAGLDLTPAQITTVGIAPAVNQFSIDRPRQVITESPGAASAYFALPAGWVDTFSSLLEVEFPARLAPRQMLDPQSWDLVRSAADPMVHQVVLDRTPAATQYVRFTFTAPWPVPTSDPTVDQINDLAFEAVAALAASLCYTSLTAESARDITGILPPRWTDGGQRFRALTEAAAMYQATYDRFLGIGPDGPIAPAYGSMDFDPSYFSVYHGGRQ